MKTLSLCLVLVVALCGLHRYFASTDVCRNIPDYYTCLNLLLRWSHSQLCLNETAYWRSLRANCSKLCRVCRGTQTECTDVEPSTCENLVRRWSYEQLCTNQTAYWRSMRSNCSRTCNLCYTARYVRMDVSNRIEGTVGESVKLDCMYYSVGYRAVYAYNKWSMKTSVVGERKLVYEEGHAARRTRIGVRYAGRVEIEKVHFVDEYRRHTYGLKLNRLTEDDEGLYTCETFTDRSEVVENSTWLEIVDERRNFDCKVDVKGLDYIGDVHQAYTGQECRHWNSPEVQRHMSTNPRLIGPYRTWSLASQTSNHCRNPDREEDGPWCYIQAENVLSWRVCDIRLCSRTNFDCKVDVKGLDYIGDVHQAYTGQECRHWNSPEVQRHMSTSARLIGPYRTWSLASQTSNHCRNPDHGEDGPWCYIQAENVPSWRVCDIRLCSNPAQPVGFGGVAKRRPNTQMLLYSLAGIIVYWKLKYA